jgi:hypothetical protein
VVDVDSGQALKIVREGKAVWADLASPITGEGQSARLRVTSKVSDPRYRVESGLAVFEWTVAEPRATILLPAGWDVASVSVMSTVVQTDGRVAIQIFNGNPGPLRVAVRAVKR